jgi:hypothetical protein
MSRVIGSSISLTRLPIASETYSSRTRRDGRDDDRVRILVAVVGHRVDQRRVTVQCLEKALRLGVRCTRDGDCRCARRERNRRAQTGE